MEKNGKRETCSHKTLKIDLKIKKAWIIKTKGIIT